jgi:Cu-Zn family superoxide dismutase
MHAFHVHGVGTCTAPDFTSAGGHYNPGAKEHGLQNPKGAHVGDMPNVVVDASGAATASFVLLGATLVGGGPGSLFQVGGTAVVLHAVADDMKTDPAGNAGARIACGVIER